MKQGKKLSFQLIPTELGVQDPLFCIIFQRQNTKKLCVQGILQTVCLSTCYMCIALKRNGKMYEKITRLDVSRP
jgi:hypothetical protein